MSAADPVPVSGATALYAIVGDPVAQVRSPQVINALFAQAGIDAFLMPLHVPRARFADTMRSLMSIRNLQGIVLTVPFKVEAMALASHLLPGARAAGAVNALRRSKEDGMEGALEGDREGSWEGDMFDGAGLIRALEDHGHAPESKRVLLVGTGGAGRAIAIALAQHGVRELVLSDIDDARAREVAQAVSEVSPDCRCAVAPAAFDGHDIVINATPLGMRPDDPLPLDLDGMGPSHVLFDIVPKPDVTPLMREAQSRGIVTIGGKRMIEGQARAITEFFGHRV